MLYSETSDILYLGKQNMWYYYESVFLTKTNGIIILTYILINKLSKSHLNVGKYLSGRLSYDLLMFVENGVYKTML